MEELEAKSKLFLTPGRLLRTKSDALILVVSKIFYEIRNLRLGLLFVLLGGQRFRLIAQGLKRK
jgi:hypothetical protein